MSILQDIYNSTYAPGRAQETMPFSLRLKERAVRDVIEEALGEEFIKRHQDDWEKAAHFRNYANFREGFKLGVALMLEIR